jgi:hypothetical protein
MRRLLPGLVFALGLATVPAIACPAAPPDVACANYGAIGRHVTTLACVGAELIVETAVEGDVRVLRIRSSSMRRATGKCAGASC